MLTWENKNSQIVIIVISLIRTPVNYSTIEYSIGVSIYLIYSDLSKDNCYAFNCDLISPILPAGDVTEEETL